MIIDLTKIKTLWYGGIKPNRKDNLLKNLNRLNLQATHIEPVIPSGITDSSECIRIGCKQSHAKALTEALKYDEPVLILEDDINSTGWFQKQIEIPDNTDAFYAGTCINGLDTYWYLFGPTGGCCGPVKILEKYDNYYRIDSMLTTHAILYCTQKYKQFCLDLINSDTDGFHLDVLFASRMSEHIIYAPKKPLFFQDCETDNLDAFIKTSKPLEFSYG